MKKNRTRSREVCMELMYQASLRGENPMDLLNYYEEELDTEYITSVFEHYKTNAHLVDESISLRLKKWTLNRLPELDKAILRVATTELLYLKDIPTSVVINEAIVLAKRYSTDNSYEYINGVLKNLI